MRWWGAVSYCKARGGNLASIHSKEENDFIFSNFCTSPYLCYIGLSDTIVENRFKWLDGSVVSYTNWKSGEPNNMGNEDAVVMHSHYGFKGTWFDVPTHREAIPVCKIVRPATQPTNPTKPPTDSPTREPTASAVPFYRYYHSHIVDHFYTTNFNELRHGGNGWIYEGIECKIYPTQVPGTVPLYRYYHGKVWNHFYTTNIKEIGTATPGRIGRYGYMSEGVAGYCYPRRGHGLKPLYRYYNPHHYDHFYTIRHGGSRIFGWRYESIACWVPLR